MLLNVCNLHNTNVYYLCVIAGNILFSVVPKLGQKNLFELIIKNF